LAGTELYYLMTGKCI